MVYINDSLALAETMKYPKSNPYLNLDNISHVAPMNPKMTIWLIVFLEDCVLGILPAILYLPSGMNTRKPPNHKHKLNQYTTNPETNTTNPETNTTIRKP